MKYMLATLCSKPIATNAMMGKNIAKIFPIVCRAASAIHTARQTSQLHPIARISASLNDNDTLPQAMLTALTPKAPPGLP